jgi:hypothetical protein
MFALWRFSCYLRHKRLQTNAAMWFAAAVVAVGCACSWSSHNRVLQKLCYLLIKHPSYALQIDSHVKPARTEAKALVTSFRDKALTLARQSSQTVLHAGLNGFI